jgi:hypothetical protein
MVTIIFQQYFWWIIGWWMALFGNFDYYDTQMYDYMRDYMPGACISWSLYINDRYLNNTEIKAVFPFLDYNLYNYANIYDYGN